MKFSFSSLIKLLVFFSLGVFILYKVYDAQAVKYAATCAKQGHTDCNLMDKLLADFGKADLKWIFLSVVLYVLSNFVRAKRWKMMFDSDHLSTKFGNSFWSIILGYFANLGLPRVGEFVRAGSFSRYEKVPFQHSLGTVVLGRAFDGIMLLVFLGITLVVSGTKIKTYLMENMTIPAILKASWVPWFLGLGFLLFIGALWFVLKSKHPLAVRVKSVVMDFWKGLSAFRRIEHKGLFLFWTVSIWVLYFFMIYFCTRSFEPVSHLGMDAALVAFVFGSLGMVIPTPGGMGSYQALIMAALVLYGVAGPDAFSFAMIVFFSINIFGNVIPGLVSLGMLPWINRHYKTDRHVATEHLT